MNKLEMAQRFAEIMLKTGLQGHWDLGDDCYHGIAQDAWMLADAMQAEADKRIDKSLPDVLNLSNSKPLDFQPDWSQAPSWAGWWAMNRNGQGVWHNRKPSHEQSMSEWVVDFSAGSDFSYRNSCDFGYIGFWTDSLRKRPE